MESAPKILELGGSTLGKGDPHEMVEQESKGFEDKMMELRSKLQQSQEANGDKANRIETVEGESKELEELRQADIHRLRETDRNKVAWEKSTIEDRGSPADHPHPAIPTVLVLEAGC